MSALVAIVAVSIALGSEPILSTIILSHPNAHPFLYQGDLDAAPEWGVVDGDRLLLRDLISDSLQIVELPAGTGLFDLYDANRDGKTELVALTSDGLCRWGDLAAVASGEADWCVVDPRFDSLSTATPTPYRLVVSNPLRIRVPSGTESTAWSLETGDPLEGVTAAALRRTAPLTRAWSIVHDRAYPRRLGGVEVDVGYRTTWSEPEADRVSATEQSTRRAIDAQRLSPSVWPSFPLTPDGTTRVHFALEPAASPFTLVRFQRLAGLDAATRREFTSARRYPGAIVAPVAQPPDFNGDGFADLLMWNAATPGRTVGSWIRAAQRRTWEVTLTAHLYDPGTARYRARPDDHLKLDAPLHNVLEGGVLGPMKAYRLEDVNGDRRSDLIVLRENGTLVIHPYITGWVDRPFEIRFEAPLREIVLTQTFGDGAWLALLRSDAAFHVVTLAENEVLLTEPRADTAR